MQRHVLLTKDKTQTVITSKKISGIKNGSKTKVLSKLFLNL